MPLRVPDHSLNMDRQYLSDFLINFARFEYAVKASGYSHNKKGYAEPDWDSYCSSLAVDFCTSPDRDLVLHLSYITNKPPKQLVKNSSGRLIWKDRALKAEWSDLRKILFLAQGVRNNVAHGSKFTARESPEKNRNAKLMAAATAIVSAFLNNSDKTRDVFNGPAP